MIGDAGGSAEGNTQLVISQAPQSRSSTVSRGGDAPFADPWAPENADFQRRIDLLSLVPLAAIIALVGTVWILVWAVSSSDDQQAQVKLATDTLWVEQTLRFQLAVSEDMLVSLALDTAGDIDMATLAARARSHIVTNPEALTAVWHAADGTRFRSFPGAGAATDEALVAQLLRIDAQPSRPVYGAVSPEGIVSMGMKLPDDLGVLTSTVSLPLLLERYLPWWIAEQYGVRIVTGDNTVLAARQRMAPDRMNPSHMISFDPPLHGIWLQINAYDRPTGFLSTTLFGAIVGLAAFAILSMLVLFRSAQRRRAVEMQLQGEMAFRRSMEESLTVGLRAKDHSGRILFINPAFCNLVGWSAEELVGRDPPMPYWETDTLPQTQERHRKLAAGGAVSQSFETRFCHRDGRKIDVQVYEAPLIDARGVHRGWMGSVIDITEAKRATRLARAQDETMARTGRLVTLGEMASTLAHELNQPLSSITSYAAGMLNLMESDKPDSGTLQMATGKIAQQAGRAGLIIRRIQDLVKKRKPTFTAIPLEEVVTETLGFLAAAAREHQVRLVTEGTAAAAVSADRILLEQVLINLIRNGMEAMAERRHGDVITVRLLEMADQVAMEVVDQGCGISSDLDGKLFDAFASTKPQGMGMGLKICRSIVELHRGQLTYSPAPGGGTVFRVALPLAVPENAGTEPPGLEEGQ